MSTTQSPYPIFYRKDGRCLKRESEVTAMEIHIPPDGKSLPLIHSPVVFPSKQRLDEAIAAMDQVDQDTYESFLGTFYSVAARNRETYHNYRQRKFEQQQLEKLNQQSTQ